MKKAICVGINNYPGFGNDLKGCVNDANDWANLLQLNGFEAKVILDGEATRSILLTELDHLITEAGTDDVIVFTYSGHGTNVIDTSGDEADEYDMNLDEWNSELDIIVAKLKKAKKEECISKLRDVKSFNVLTKVTRVIGRN